MTELESARSINAELQAEVDSLKSTLRDSERRLEEASSMAEAHQQKIADCESRIHSLARSKDEAVELVRRLSDTIAAQELEAAARNSEVCSWCCCHLAVSHCNMMVS